MKLQALVDEVAPEVVNEVAAASVSSADALKAARVGLEEGGLQRTEVLATLRSFFLPSSLAL